MEYRNKIENIINNTSLQRKARNAELYEYSKKRFEEYDDKKEQGKNSLTSLPGLRNFFYAAGEIIAANPDKTFGVITMDISQFKALNELCGRKAGDELLFFIAELFKKAEAEYPNSIAGHARADNFLICMEFEEEKEMINLAEEMYDAISHYPIGCKVSPAFGICPDYEPLPSVSFLKDCATIAMNGIKGKFYAKYAVFDENMRKEILREKQIENDIINALENGELQLYIQPKVDMLTKKLCGGEALVRWMHKDLGMIPPGDFIPVLEKNGFIINVDYFIWEKVFAFQHEMAEKGIESLPISINISRVHVHDTELCNKLVSLAIEYDVSPELVPLEITESAFESKQEIMFSNLSYLQSKGFGISMDDFGTGYSSLQMLSSRPIDEIKLDRSFVLNLDGHKGKIITENIIRMINEIGMELTTEGIETEAQKDLILKFGCKKAQGFLFSRAVPADNFATLLEKENSRNSR